MATTDPATREKLYTQVQAWNEENVAIVPIYLPSVITVAAPSVVGLTFDIDGQPLFATASLAP